jgi:hypothetical protein
MRRTSRSGSVCWIRLCRGSRSRSSISRRRIRGGIVGRLKLSLAPRRPAYVSTCLRRRSISAPAVPSWESSARRFGNNCRNRSIAFSPGRRTGSRGICSRTTIRAVMNDVLENICITAVNAVEERPADGGGGFYPGGMPALGDLVRCTSGAWMVRPPARASAPSLAAAYRSPAVLMPRVTANV